MRIKPARSNQLPAWLSAKRTAAFGSAPRCSVPRRFSVGSGSWQGQFQGQKRGQSAPRKSMPVVYLAFSRGEVAERLKAAVC